MFQEFYAQSRHLIWPLLGLLIFLASFTGVMIYAVFGLRDPARVKRLAGLPLEPDDGDTNDRTREWRTQQDKGS